jgi:hypothetical protein
MHQKLHMCYLILTLLKFSNVGSCVPILQRCDLKCFVLGPWASHSRT